MWNNFSIGSSPKLFFSVRSIEHRLPSPPFFAFSCPPWTADQATPNLYKVTVLYRKQPELGMPSNILGVCGGAQLWGILLCHLSVKLLKRNPLFFHQKKYDFSTPSCPTHGRGAWGDTRVVHALDSVRTCHLQKDHLFCVKWQRSPTPTKATFKCSGIERSQNLVVYIAQSFSRRGKSLAILQVAVGQGCGRARRGRLHIRLAKTPAVQHNFAPSPPSCGSAGGTGWSQFADTKPHGCCNPRWTGRKSKVQYCLQQITYSFFQHVRQWHWEIMALQQPCDCLIKIAL